MIYPSLDPSWFPWAEQFIVNPIQHQLFRVESACGLQDVVNNFPT
jgi:hypothetical protein